MEFTVEEDFVGSRLDLFLAAKLDDYSRSQLKKMVEDAAVKVNGELARKANFKLKLNDVVSVFLRKISSKIEPRKMNLEIIFEDNDLLVINKPPNLVVHPTATNVNDVTTLVHGLLDYLGNDFASVGNEYRPGIVHRLDKDTSGVMLIAKTKKSYLELVKAFSERKVKKTYESLVMGHLDHKKATIDSPIVRSANYKRMMVMDSHKSKNAITHYCVEEEFANASLLEIDLETGRTHQIRLHASSIGHPVLGDDLYGNTKENKRFEEEYGLKRQFLHAKRIALNHPITKKELQFEAPLSDDLAAVLKQL